MIFFEELASQMQHHHHQSLPAHHLGGPCSRVFKAALPKCYVIFAVMNRKTVMKIVAENEYQKDQHMQYLSLEKKTI